jgi:chromosome segregation ATPase
MEGLKSKLKELKKLGYLGGDRRPGFSADHRQEIEERMQKMRAEMDRLREEMTRLRAELGQGGGGTR